MKVLKIILLSILSIFIAAYLAFLFVLPYAVNLNKYNPQITKELEKATGCYFFINDLKIKTGWNLSAGVNVGKLDLRYPDGEKFAQVNDLDVKLSLIPLLFKQIKIDSVSAEKLLMKLHVYKDGDLILNKFIREQSHGGTAQMQFPFTFSNSMPDIKIDKYRFSFIDTESEKTYSIKGTDFKINDFTLNKKIRVKAKGDLVSKDRKQISYDIQLFSKVFPPAETSKKQTPQKINIIDIFEDLYKYNLCANINANLKLTGNPDDTRIDGNLDLDKITLTVEGKTLPQSNLNLKFKGDKIKINSNFYTDVNEKALITGTLNNGKRKSINLNVLSDKTDLGNAFLIANNLLELIGRKDLEGISANGHINANFNVKSDFKTIQSSGFLKIDNANIVHNLYKVALSSICADIDFSSDEIYIKKSSAKVNGEPISIKGTIDKYANANLSIFAQDIQLKGLLATLGQIQTLKENDITSGLIDIDASLKGRLDKAIPTADIVVKNVNLRNKPNKMQVKFANAKIKATSNGKKTNGKIELTGLRVYPQGTVISIPSTSLVFNEKDLIIEKASLFLNSSKIDIFGKITDYATKKINFDVTARGLIKSAEIKAMLPKSNQAGVTAVGKIPLLVRITGTQKQKIHAQMLANNSNHLAVFDINSLRGKTSLINAELLLSGNELKINEITLYALGANKGLSQNMGANLSSGTKIATIDGNISNFSSKTPYLNGISVNIPTQIATSIPGYANSVIRLKGGLNLNGNANNPEIRGTLAIPTVYLPSLKTNLRNLMVQFNKNSITANCPQMSIANSAMGFNALLDSDFARGIVIKNVNFSAENLDLDSLGQALSNLPQSSNGPGADLGVTILGGKSSIQRVKTGAIIATNVTSDVILKNNILKLNNVNADAFTGKVVGTIAYNLIYGGINLNLQGRDLSAGPSIKALTGMSDSLVGRLDFDSNVSMVGYTQEQLLQSLRGSTRFIISNGRMGKLGKLEHLLYAQNVISNNFFRASLNAVAKAATMQNTGVFKYIKGEMTFSNGWANLKYIKTSGPSMSMYIRGRFNILNNSANLIVLGRLSDDVVRILGPVGELSVDKMLSYIPKVGTITAALINQMTTNPEVENTSLIPPLTPQTELPTKDFKVVINGGVDSQSSVKSFKWLSAPQVAPVGQSYRPAYTVPQVKETVENAKKQVQDNVREISAPVADFINSLPDLR